MSIGIYSYKRFDPENDIISTEQSAIDGLFLTTQSIRQPSWMHETSSTSPTYYIKLTGSNSTAGSYDIATICYGYSGSDNTSQSQTIYQQFTNYFIGRDGTGSCDFNFSPTANASKSDTYGFIAICLARDRYQDQLQPGTWQINCLTSSDATITASFTDGAATSSNPAVRYGSRGRWDYIYSGSKKIGNTMGTITGAEPWGLVYYDHGIIILNSAKCPNAEGGWTGSEDDVGGSNTKGAQLFATKSLEGIEGYGKVNLKSTLYFCRLGNREFNFSQNPTYYNPSTGVILNSDLKNSPRTYPTTIGLYNDKDELIAVGKLETPQEKSFTKELIVSARLDF